MKRETVSEIMLTLLLIGMLTLAFNIQPVATNLPVHNIDTDLDYATIQEAIDAPETLNGHTILVDQGIYNERLTINKSINLMGASESTTKIDGNNVGTVIDVYASNFNISEFTIMRSGSGSFERVEAGIYFHESNSSSVTRSILTSNHVALFFNHSSSNTVERNLVFGNNHGLFLDSSNGNRIMKNMFVYNWRTGIYLKASENNNVFQNQISYSTNGIELRWLGNNSIIANDVSNSSIGMNLFNSSNSLIYHNNFLYNTIQINRYRTEISNTWDNGYEGNFWSDYLGEDLDGDGVGDTSIPHLGVDWYPLMAPRGIPDISIESPENKTYPTNEIFLAFAVNELPSWMGYSLNGQTNVTIKCLFAGNLEIFTCSTTLSGLSDGLHTIAVYANDTAGNMGASDIVHFTVNMPPIADAGPDQTVVEDTVVSFDAGNSSDNMGIISFDWDFGDENKGTGVTTIHIYTEAGNYTVTLTVKDSAGNNDTDSIVITVLLDTDGDGTPDITDPDDDNDGMPDTWETANGLNPLDSGDASLDPDGDGLTNLEEYQQGTDPNVSDAEAPPIEPTEGFPLWMIGVAGAVAFIGIAVALVLWKRKGTKTQQTRKQT